MGAPGEPEGEREARPPDQVVEDDDQPCLVRDAILHDRAEKAEREVGRLRAGIAACLDTNGHLADGEDCTLIGLKRCKRDPAATRESNGGAA